MNAIPSGTGPRAADASGQLGAVLGPGGCLFTLWAPAAHSVTVHLEAPLRREHPLRALGGGWFSATVADVTAGTRYRYALDRGEAFPDPASRFQPEGPHGPSQVVDPTAFHWSDANWRGVNLRGQVFYELHIGTFTRAGTFDAALERLEFLQWMGITCVELMPVAECPGRRNWGYDGVALFAPSHNYGDPDAMKRFVDRAHGLGIAVILDVVYNHLGPDGNYLPRYSPHYFSDVHKTEWGDPLNFDGEHSTPVREFALANACYWIREFHCDGLRLDATQGIFDSGHPHLLAELSARARAAAPARGIILVAENEPQHASDLLPAARGGFGLDAMWNDDFHHSAMVAATGQRHAYYRDYLGRAQEFVAAMKHGFLFQGQYYTWQQQPRGEPLQTPIETCVAFLQNHDQIANSLTGQRLHQLTSPGLHRALTALTLLGPQTPLLFMGQEFNASAPFVFFADHGEPLRSQVFEGRKGFLAQLPGAGSAQGLQLMVDPASDGAFDRCVLDWSEAQRHTAAIALHRDLLALRREDPVLRLQGESGFDGAVLDPHAFLLRWNGADQGDRLLVVNLGGDLMDQPLPEPLLACGRGLRWQLRWSTESACYGGTGALHPLTATGWRIAAQSATLLIAVPELQTGSHTTLDGFPASARA